MNPRLSIIMPCYGGEEFIQNSIRKTEEIVSKFEENFEIIIVIDGFVDRGFEEARTLQGEFPNLKVEGYEKNRGKGYAVKYGLDLSSGSFVAFLDSDLDYHPESLETFIKIAEDAGADFVIGNRRDKRSVTRYPLTRKIASRGFNFYANLLFPALRLRDTQAGIKLMRREPARAIFNRIKDRQFAQGYSFDICLLVNARRLGLKIIEAPCTFEMQSTTIGSGKHFLYLIYKMGKEVLEFKQSMVACDE